MAKTRTILFLGASYAGLGSAHYFLKHVLPGLPNDGDVTYDVVLVDPSSKFYVRPASPRAAADAKLLPTEKLFVDIEPGFKQYGDKMRFVQGKAVSWDEESRVVTVRQADGKEQAIKYWALILATGSKSADPIFSLQGGSHDEIKAALHAMQDRVAKAKDIVVVGGGPAGVEFAGEVGDLLNGAGGCWSSAPKVKITLLTASHKLLPALRQSIAEQAETYLRRVGVEVRYNARLADSSTLPGGRTRVVLDDGERLETDVLVSAMGVAPMSDYVPAHLKDAKGYVMQNTATLRVDAAGPRVYAIGDLGSASNKSVPAILECVPVLATNLRRDLLAAHSDPTARPDGEDRTFVPYEKELQIVPVGRSKGVGAVYGWRVPSIMVWAIKGRNYMMSGWEDDVYGKRWMKEVEWKQKA